jgi:hypothetical protein
LNDTVHDKSYAFRVSVDRPFPVADPLSLGLPPDVEPASTIRPPTAPGARDVPIARVFAPRSGLPGVRETPSPFWIVDGSSDTLWCSVHPVAPGAHDVRAADGTVLARVTRRAGRVLPWPRRVRWSVGTAGSPLPATGKEGTWYAWLLLVVTAPLWAVCLLVVKVYDLLNGESDDYVSRPARTRWRVKGMGTVLDFRGLGEKAFHSDPGRLDVRLAHALAILRTWEDKDRAMAEPRRVSKEDAVAAGARFLRTECYPDRADSVVMLPDSAVEFTYGWTVRFDFREHIETGDPTKAPFSAVVVVPHDGTPAHFAPTFPPTETYMTLRATGAWPPA